MHRSMIFFILLSVTCRAAPPVQRDCDTPGCQFQFHPSDFNPSGPFNNETGMRHPNDYAKTFLCDAPWRVDSLDDIIPLYIQIEGTDVDSVNEMQCLVIYDVSNGDTPPDPVEDFWGDYEYTPDHPGQIYKAECGGCELYNSQTGMYWMIVESFFHDGSLHGTQADGTPLTARNLGYCESDLGQCITLTFRLIYEESLNWTDIHDQDVRIYLGREPLPALDHFYLGDTHTHTWSTYYFLEIGAAGAMMFKSMQTCGLAWQLVSDHAYNLSDGKWDTVTSECQAGTVAGDFIALRGEECDDGYKLDQAHHFLASGITDWIPTYETEPPVLETIQEICNQGGFTYGAHTTTPNWIWSTEEVIAALDYECFRGLEDYNERCPYSSEDILHPWGSNPELGQWDSVDTGWDSDLIDGLRRWDEVMSMQMEQPRYQVFFLGGSDAHGSMNYHVDWDVIKRDLLFIVFSNALGKVRNAAYCPDGLNTINLLSALYNGQCTVTDGPMAAIGISRDGTASDYQDCEDQMGGTAQLPWPGPAHVLIQWASSVDYGPVREIRLFRGDASTGQAPDQVASIIPSNGYAGVDATLAVDDLILPAYQNPGVQPDCYIRAEAYTYNPDTGPDAPGDVSIGGYDPVSNVYQYRAITNPVWLVIQPAPTTSPSPTQTSDPTVSPTATPSVSPTSIPSDTATVPPTSTTTPTPVQTATQSPSMTVTTTPTATPSSTPSPLPTVTSTPTGWFTSSPTPEASRTATPENTASYSPTASATPDETCSELGVRLYMPSHHFKPGDPCSCRVTVCNPDSGGYGTVPLFVILDVYGTYFFAPSFADFDHIEINLKPGSQTFSIIEEFGWPENCGTGNRIVWYAGMTDAGINDLMGSYDFWEFSWES